MGLRFAILKEIKGENKVVLEYDKDQILERLQARVAEKLSKGPKISKKAKFTHSREEIHDAIEAAYNGLIREFKEQTIQLQ